jgi:tRNA(fMet)-specific endonuclease VapC
MAIVVDTDVISFFQKRDSRFELFRQHLDRTEKFISFMTWAELRRWPLERDWSETRRNEFLNSVEQSYGIIYSDDRLCEIWAQIMTKSRKIGRTIAVADAWVASVALMFDIPLVTHNRKHFEHISGLSIL